MHFETAGIKSLAYLPKRMKNGNDKVGNSQSEVGEEENIAWFFFFFFKFTTEIIFSNNDTRSEGEQRMLYAVVHLHNQTHQSNSLHTLDERGIQRVLLQVHVLKQKPYFCF